ncbi:MAG TPA: hypothetical protein VLB47_03285, partial [Solirubrobacteraceae bacterium]|nr:hypothetical protein [Solirubrobacteraceae bacterium]
MRALLLTAALAGLLAGCGGAGAGTRSGGADSRAASRPAPAPRLTARAPCPGAPGFRCATLRVPLDRAAGAGGPVLRLRVAL